MSTAIRTQFIAALLFLVCPLLGLAYLVWDLSGLLLGGGMGLVGLALLALQKQETVVVVHKEVHQSHQGLEELLKEREEALAQLDERCQELEGYAEHKGAETHHLTAQVEELRGQIRRLLELEPSSDDEGVLPEHHESDELWIGDLPHSSRREVASQYDAHALLTQCLEQASNLTGIRELAGSSPRFEQLSMGDYAIDLRQLFEAFRGETGAVIIIFSPKEGRLLFASNLIRGLLGWSSERFVRDFEWLIRKGGDHWQEGVRLGLGEEVDLELTFRTASDEEVAVGCALGRLAKGAFRGLILGVLYRN